MHVYNNITCLVGWAYDRKTVSNEVIKARVRRTGDGSHIYSTQEKVDKVFEQLQNEVTSHVWGWDDKDMKESDKKFVEIK